MPTYEQSLQTLHRAPLSAFVSERKRLAAALRAGGDDDGARELAARRRPTISAWTVNQLYWNDRRAFDEMLDAAESVRSGDLAATTAYRQAIAKLRERAATVLKDAGHAAPD